MVGMTLWPGPVRSRLWSPRGALTKLPTGGMPPKKPGSAAPAGAKPPSPALGGGDALAASRTSGETQDCGTDNLPTVVASPRPAATPVPPAPDAPTAGVVELASAPASGAAAAAAVAEGTASPYSPPNSGVMPEAVNNGPLTTNDQ